MNINKTLVRLMDADSPYGNMVSAFYTKNAADFLKQYYFCKENDILIQIPHDPDVPNDYDKYVAGEITDIEVCFGGRGGNMPCVDVWIGNLF